jgi:hypothetical protein
MLGRKMDALVWFGVVLSNLIIESDGLSHFHACFNGFNGFVQHVQHVQHDNQSSAMLGHPPSFTNELNEAPL